MDQLLEFYQDQNVTKKKNVLNCKEKVKYMQAFTE